MVRNKTKQGHIVTVYEDPITQTKAEGKAKLIRRIVDLQAYPQCQWWEVEFVDDKYVTQRLIGK